MITQQTLLGLCFGVLVAIPLALSTECGTRTMEKNSIITSLIIDGDMANPGEFPWQAAVWVNGRFNCGGSLVKDRYIITAASCVTHTSFGSTHVRRPQEVKVTLGSIRTTSNDPDRMTIRVSKIFVKSSFRKAVPYTDDFAVITLASPVSTTHKISPICLPTNCSHDDGDIEECYSAGWGRTISIFPSHPDYLMKTKERIYPMSRCVAAGFIEGFDPISQICVKTTRATARICFGDGGGALACRSSSGQWVLRGLFAVLRRPCASQFTVYTRVCHYLDDILKIVGE